MSNKQYISKPINEPTKVISAIDGTHIYLVAVNSQLVRVDGTTFEELFVEFDVELLHQQIDKEVLFIAHDMMIDEDLDRDVFDEFADRISNAVLALIVGEETNK